MMTSPQVVETSVTVNDNSPFQDYPHPDDHTTRSKNECDEKMVRALDSIPYGEMPKLGQTARFLINAKEKLGLGIKPKNVRR